MENINLNEKLKNASIHIALDPYKNGKKGNKLDQIKYGLKTRPDVQFSTCSLFIYWLSLCHGD